MTAVPLIFGRLTAADYEEEVARDPRIDALRAKMQVRENPDFTRDYYDPDKRFIGNAVQIRFTDGTMTERVEISVPIGHRLRRAEGLPLLEQKFRASLSGKLSPDKFAELREICSDGARLQTTEATHFMSLLIH
jgi:2-methylcitrate dehydratase